MSDESSKLTNHRVKVVEGYYCDQKLRVDGILFFKELTGKAFEDASEDIVSVMKAQAAKTDIADVILAIRPLLMSLMYQCHLDATVEELTAAIGKIDLDKFMSIFNKLKIFEDSGKNEQGPVAKKAKRLRQPVKPRKK